MRKQEKILQPEYDAYLKSSAWKAIRSRIIAERKVCESCGGIEPYLVLHHKTYVRLYDELDSDLTLLCSDCHDGLHGRWGKIAKRAARKAIKEKALLIAFHRSLSGPPKTEADRWIEECKKNRAAANSR